MTPEQQSEFFKITSRVVKAIAEGNPWPQVDNIQANFLIGLINRQQNEIEAVKATSRQERQHVFEIGLSAMRTYVIDYIKQTGIDDEYPIAAEIAKWPTDIFIEGYQDRIGGHTLQWGIWLGSKETGTWLKNWNGYAIEWPSLSLAREQLTEHTRDNPALNNTTVRVRCIQTLEFDYLNAKNLQFLPAEETP